jgi:uncharacterized protein YukE
MGDIALKYEDMTNAANQLMAAKKEVEDKLNALNTMITNLRQGAFQTQLASEKFQNSYRDWNTGARTSMSGLEGMAQFLKQVVDKHKELDTQLSTGLQQQ